MDPVQGTVCTGQVLLLPGNEGRNINTFHEGLASQLLSIHIGFTSEVRVKMGELWPT